MATQTLSGWITGVSGRVDSLEVRVLDLEKNALGNSSRDDMLQIQAFYASRFNTLQTRIDTAENTLDKLIDYAQNLKKDYTDLRIQFTGHTGVAASSGHFGGL